ncbi:ligand-binding sensor domain-containing diguanylate cyclase [Lichenicoccus sp.]|uniref:ligand-binding sensor domain-containing diguanylate cyclase n=1 Tax=Lichenicoccus sp. TaxID=2781899 RepID=UPI003D15126F
MSEPACLPVRLLKRILPTMAAIAVVVLLTLRLLPAYAARSNFRTYDADQGLLSIGGSCMVHDRAGYILVCSEHGVFAYDGRRFVNFGPDQGLRSGGIVYALALSAEGRMAVEYSDEVLVSDRPSDAEHPPSSLSFSAIRHDGISFDSDRPHRLAPWHDGFVLLAGGTTVGIVLSNGRAPHVEGMGYDRGEQGLLRNAQAVFSVRNHLWETTDDGLICAADPGAVKCYGETDGLAGGPWLDVIAADGGGVLARSASSVATFTPESSRWRVVELPDQGDRYLNYTHYLGLFRAPDGSVVTQADHGLAVLRAGGWQALSIAEGAPSGTIVGAMTDTTGQFWLQAYGRGLLRWIGYGKWETLDKQEGLSAGLPWQSVRLPDGSMWVATDTGIDEIQRRGRYPQVGRVVPGPFFALATGPHGHLWASYGAKGVYVINPVDGSTRSIAVPPVDVILRDPTGFMWIGTEAGLFRVDARAHVPGPAVLAAAAHTQVLDVIADRDGGIYYLADNHLRHRHANGTDALVTGLWPPHSFGPQALAFGHDGSLWAGGAEGLFQLVLSGDHVTSFQAISTRDTQSNTIQAVMVDHRGWVWIGTNLGVSVFNGESWASVDADNGLLSNDVQQLGLREDPDGSIWISTSRGLTHLLDPSSLFANQPLKVLISKALLGNSPVRDHRMPYTEAALSLQFGTPDYAAERSIMFRYRLSGVDHAWVETTTGAVRYALVPPGHHTLTVVSVDQLTHRASAPRSLVIDIAYPWWRQWWAETFWILCALGGIYGVVRLRLRVVLIRQADLKRHIAEATAQLQARTEELHYQAAHDSLTRLLNRSEIERRLAMALTRGRAGDELIVALLDIDHFKRINDRHGHLGGDDVLRAMGRLVAAVIGRGEFAGRYGGEEILLVLQDGNGTGAARILDLHRAVQEEAFRAAGTVILVTCSIGLTWAVPGDDWESLVGRADKALYDAKTRGRNRVIENPRIEPSRADKTTDDPAPGSGTPGSGT